MNLRCCCFFFTSFWHKSKVVYFYAKVRIKRVDDDENVYLVGLENDRELLSEQMEDEEGSRGVIFSFENCKFY